MAIRPLIPRNNLSDLTNAGTARTNLGLGTAATSAATDFQPIDSDLTAIAALTTTAFGRSLLALANQAALLAAAGAAASSHTHAQSDVTNLTTDLAAKAPLASPTFTGNIQPNANNTLNSGSSSARWATVFGVAGNFSGTVTVNVLSTPAAAIGNLVLSSAVVFPMVSAGGLAIRPGGTTAVVEIEGSSGANADPGNGVRFKGRAGIYPTATDELSVRNNNNSADGTLKCGTLVSSATVRVATYTDLTLPTAGTAGRIAYSSDSGIVHDNGTNWRKPAGGFTNV